jgi:hypothetical protein
VSELAGLGHFSHLLLSLLLSKLLSSSS